MNNINLKRRRPYCHEDAPAEPVLQGPVLSSPSTGIDTSPLSTDDRYILGQAASILDVSIPQLLGINRQQDPRYILEQAASILHVPLSNLLELPHQHYHSHKRARLSSDISMSSLQPGSPLVQDAHEKSPHSGPLGQASSESRRSFPILSETGSFLGLTASRVADCFASFSVCQTSSSYDPDTGGYQAVPVTTTFHYNSERPYAVDSSSPVHSQRNEPYAVTAAQADQTGLFACDDPALMAQYMQNYPPLQPTRTAGEQPSTRTEGMFYPHDGIPGNDYFTKAEAPSVLRPEPLVVTRPTYASDMMAVSSPPTYAHPATMGGAPPRYSMLHAYSTSDQLVQDGRAARLQVPSGECSLDVVFPNQKAPTARRGPFKDHAERQKTAQTRKIGSCIRCRMQRIRCNADPDDPRGACIGCKKVSAKIWRLPCLRLKINDVALSKPGQVEGYEWTLRWKDNMALADIDKWASSEIKTIRVTEGYTGRHVELQVREFIPQDGDRLERSWVSNGVTKSVRIPPFAIVDLDAAKSAYDAYIRKGLVECCKRILGPKEKLLWQTYFLALKMGSDPTVAPQERELITSTLDLWMSIRLTTKSCEIVGEETLGMSPDIMGDSNPRIPLPPVMGAQLDSILIHHIQSKLRHDTLENLQKLTTESRQKAWLTTYLVTFILLHNISLVIKHDAGYARKHGIKRRFAREDKVKQYYLGAVTLLAYFHYCNKGIYPFSEDCKDQDLRTLAKLDEQSMQFVRYTRKYATEHKRHWQELWDGNSYENDYYFVSQLFEQNWQPRTMA